MSAEKLKQIAADLAAKSTYLNLKEIRLKKLETQILKYIIIKNKIQK